MTWQWQDETEELPPGSMKKNLVNECGVRIRFKIGYRERIKVMHYTVGPLSLKVWATRYDLNGNNMRDTYTISSAKPVFQEISKHHVGVAEIAKAISKIKSDLAYAVSQGPITLEEKHSPPTNFEFINFDEPGTT